MDDRWLSRAVMFAVGLTSGLVPLPISAQPAPVGPEYEVATSVGYNADIASRPTGGFVVVWQSQGIGNDADVFMRQLNAIGAPIDSELQLNSYTTGPQGGAKVAGDGSGNFVVVWIDANGHDGNGNGLFAQRFNGAGAAVGSELQINEYTTGAQPNRGFDVASDAAGNFIVVWGSLALPSQDGDGEAVIGRRFDSAGAAIGAEFQANTYTTGDQAAPSVAVDVSGDFIVAWESSNGVYPSQDGSVRGIFAQRFASGGAPVGTEFQVNTYTTGPQTLPAVAAAPSGDFLITWLGSGPGDSDGGVFGQRFSSSGVPAGSEFSVNAYTTGDQALRQSCTVDPAGNFVVTWASDGQDGDYQGIFARRFDSSGAAQGTDFQVNTYNTGDQSMPAISADASGNFVVVWEDEQRGLVLDQFFSPVFGCPPVPSPACRTGVNSMLLLKNRADDGKDKLLWKWGNGPATHVEFGDPTATRAYALCIYDNNFTTLLLTAQVPPDPTKWQDLQYKDAGGSAAGIRRISLKAGLDDAKILVKGKGMNLPDPTLGALVAPIRVQLINNETNVCFESTYAPNEVIKNNPDLLKAKSAN